MASDAELALILTQERLSGAVPPGPAALIRLDAATRARTWGSRTPMNLSPRRGSTDTASRGSMPVR